MAKQSAPQELTRIAPKLVEVTNDVLFGDVWERPGLSPVMFFAVLQWDRWPPGPA